MIASVTMHMAAKYAVDKKYIPDDYLTFLLKSFGCTRKVYNLYTDYLYTKLE